jgi:L-lactate dehydrogenase (cytochrome)
MVSSNASLSFEEIANNRVHPEQVLFFQFYKQNDNEKAIARIREAERLGYKAIFLTVDAPFIGNREGDIRAPWQLDDINAGQGTSNPDMPLARKDDEIMEQLIDTGYAGSVGLSLINDDVDLSWEEVGSSAGLRIVN